MYGGCEHKGLIFNRVSSLGHVKNTLQKLRRFCVCLNLTHPYSWMCKQRLCARTTASPFKIITCLPVQKSVWNSLRLQWLRKSEDGRKKKKINIHVMPFKSLINIRGICPLAEIQRPVNANEWERKAIRVHYWLPLVRKGASLRLSTGRPCEHQTHNSKILHPLNDRWETCAFCVSREKTQHKLIMEAYSISRRVALFLTGTFWGYLLRWSSYKQWCSRLVEGWSLSSFYATE